MPLTATQKQFLAAHGLSAKRDVTSKIFDDKFSTFIAASDEYKSQDGEKNKAKYIEEKRKHYREFLKKQEQVQAKLEFLKTIDPSGKILIEIVDPVENSTAYRKDAFKIATGNLETKEKEINAKIEKLTGRSGNDFSTATKNIRKNLTHLNNSAISGEFEKKLEEVFNNTQISPDKKFEKIETLDKEIQKFLETWVNFNSELAEKIEDIAILKNAKQKDASSFEEEIKTIQKAAVAAITESVLLGEIKKLKELKNKDSKSISDLIEITKKEKKETYKKTLEEYKKLLLQKQDILINNLENAEIKEKFSKAEDFAKKLDYASGIKELNEITTPVTTSPEQPAIDPTPSPKVEPIELGSEELARISAVAKAWPAPPENFTFPEPKKKQTVSISQNGTPEIALSFIPEIEKALSELESIDFEKAQEFRKEKNLTLGEVNAAILVKENLTEKEKTTLLAEAEKWSTSSIRLLNDRFSGLKKSLSLSLTSLKASIKTGKMPEAKVAHERIQCIHENLNELQITYNALQTKIDESFGKIKILHGSARTYTNELLESVTKLDDIHKLKDFYDTFKRKLETSLSAEKAKAESLTKFNDAYKRVKNKLDALKGNPGLLQKIQERFKQKDSKYLKYLETTLDNLHSQSTSDSVKAWSGLSALEGELDTFIADPGKVIDMDSAILKANEEKEQFIAQWKIEEDTLKKYIKNASSAIAEHNGDKTLLDTINKLEEAAKQFFKSGDYVSALKKIEEAKEYALFVISNPQGMKLHSRKEIAKDVNDYKKSVRNLNAVLIAISTEIQSLKTKGVEESLLNKATRRFASLGNSFDENLFNEVALNISNPKNTEDDLRRQREEGLAKIRSLELVLQNHPLMKQLPFCPFKPGEIAQKLAILMNSLNRLKGNFVTCC